MGISMFVPVEAINQQKIIEDMEAKDRRDLEFYREELKKQALAKLTPLERKALGY